MSSRDVSSARHAKVVIDRERSARTSSRETRPSKDGDSVKSCASKLRERPLPSTRANKDTEVSDAWHKGGLFIDETSGGLDTSNNGPLYVSRMETRDRRASVRKTHESGPERRVTEDVARKNFARGDRNRTVAKELPPDPDVSPDLSSRVVGERSTRRTRLIECVRRHVELYDLTDEKYIDGNYKQNVWRRISQELKQSVMACKTRWNNIRDNYRKSLKRRVTRNGKSKNVKYRYEEQLAFLLPFIKEMDLGNVVKMENEISTDTPSSTGRRGENRRDDDDRRDTRAATSPELETTRTGTYNRSCHKRPLSASAQRAKRIRNDSSCRTERSIDSVSSIVTPVVPSQPAESDVSDTRTYVASPSSVHSVDAFLAGVAPSLKSLSPYLLNVTKTKIFTVVQEAEMLQIIKQREQCRKRRLADHDAAEQRRSSSPDESAITVSAYRYAYRQSGQQRGSFATTSNGDALSTNAMDSSRGFADET